MKISIADMNSDAQALAEFFNRNLTPNYISHSELQGYRAIAPGRWAADIANVLEREIRERLRKPRDQFPSIGDWRGVIVSQESGTVVGLSLVTSSHSAATPYGVVEDIVIDSLARARGKGELMMRWIIDRFHQAGIGRIFLESGIGNDEAHHFFERLGFKQTSVVMMMETARDERTTPDSAQS